MKFTKFSRKQTIILTWWTKNSPLKDKEGIIADGSIRAGKTLSMAISFVFWAMNNFDGMQFGMSGKSVSSFNRNITFWLVGTLKLRGYKVIHNRSDNYLEISIRNKDTGKKHTNWFYIFGGTDERSYQFIQGMTAAGWFFDEVAIQPESFVNQATGRCSIDGAKIWFNCNPDKPLHWFKTEFIDKAKEKNLIHLHFTMDDNPSLSESVKKRYKEMYSGVFYLRYILGLWALAEGIIYDMLDENNYYEELPDETIRWTSDRYICIDYGTTNPTAIYNVYDNWEKAYIDDEYYYDSKEQGKQKTDEQLADDLEAFIERQPQTVECIILDPSAASFKACLRYRGWRVKDADNEVLTGIRIVSSAFHQKKLLINKSKCPKLIGELGGYVWDNNARDRGNEKPVKENDHGCITGETLIDTINGKIPIKDLVNTTGKCYCINTKTRRKAISNYYDVRKTGINKKCYRIKLSNGKYIEATEDHKVLTKHGWKRIDELTTKDKVVKINYVDSGYNLVDIESIEYIGEHDVYNMEVEKHHNYSVNGGLIIHNCDSIRYFTNTIMKKRIEGRI